MVLSIAFDQFTPVGQKLQICPSVCVRPYGTGVIVTGANPTSGVIISSIVSLSAADAKKKLQADHWETLDGQWSTEAVELQEQTTAELTVGAVAYKSREAKPGLWVDAFAEPQNQTQVLRAMYDELTETGELGDVSFEEFIRLADPNVVILAPADMARFAMRRSQPCP